MQRTVLAAACLIQACHAFTAPKLLIARPGLNSPAFAGGASIQQRSSLSMSSKDSFETFTRNRRFSPKVDKRNVTPNLSNTEQKSFFSLGSPAKFDEDGITAEANIPFKAVASLLGVAATVAAMQHPAAIQQIEGLLSDPAGVLTSVVSYVQDMGPAGVLYFGAFYTLAEILGIPATPLTASAGYLFGAQEGTAIVLVSAVTAATIAFWLGRTLLRDYVEDLLKDFPKFKAIDKAIGKEGFKLMFIIRLSPIFPFSISSYLYGCTSVKFWDYFWGTALGFLPGTFAYVYTGQVGAELTLNSSSQPWYVYAGGLAVLAGILKVVADVATKAIAEVEAAEEAT